MSYRTGHQVLALMMQDVADRNIPPAQVGPQMLEQAIEKYTGRKIVVTSETAARLFDAMQCVRERKYRGGASPDRVREHIEVARANLDTDRQWAATRAASVEAARNRLDVAFADLEKQHRVQ